MQDLLFIGTALALFGLTALLAKLCDALAGNRSGEKR